MANRRSKIFFSLIVLYLITWIGGYKSHSAFMKREAQRLYQEAKQRDDQDAAMSRAFGNPVGRPRVSEHGPQSDVTWCVPLLPGVLIANSFYVVGPLYGRGGIKVVIYYVFGSWACEPFGGWVS
jgi:hypothetical protein